MKERYQELKEELEKKQEENQQGLEKEEPSHHVGNHSAMGGKLILLYWASIAWAVYCTVCWALYCTVLLFIAVYYTVHPNNLKALYCGIFITVHASNT